METIVTIVGGILALLIPALLKYAYERRKKIDEEKLKVPTVPSDELALKRARERVRNLRNSLHE